MATKIDDKVSKLKDILEGFDDAVLMTKAQTGAADLHGRPMRIAEVATDTSLWFFTGIDTGKVREALADDEGYVILQQRGKQVVLRGTFSISKDQQKIDQLWSKPLEVWFPEGPRDPNVCLMRFAPIEAEYWDNSGLKGAKYIWESAKALVTGTTPQITDKDQHGKVNLGRH